MKLGSEKVATTNSLWPPFLVMYDRIPGSGFLLPSKKTTPTYHTPTLPDVKARPDGQRGLESRLLAGGGGVFFERVL